MKIEQMLFKSVHQGRRQPLLFPMILIFQVPLRLEHNALEIDVDQQRFLEVFVHDIAVSVLTAPGKALVEQVVQCSVDQVQIVQDEEGRVSRVVLDFRQDFDGVLLGVPVEVEGASAEVFDFLG